MGYEIGPRLKQVRTEKGLSQKEAAAKIGVSVTRLANWEQGTNRPDVDLLAKICEVYDVDASVLLGDKDTTIRLTKHEEELIKAYRKSTRMREAVDVLLGINKEEKRRW